ncbi:MAG: hypothetical protein GF344_04875 [Chitinivibrionales bacterium]|nr:hypothetical protein [Chitinivibrionales bacterium]
MPESKSKRFARKPIGNFFIKKELQVRLILKIVLSVVLSTLIFAVTLLATYHFTYGGLVYYPVDLQEGIGERTPIINLIMLPLLVSAFLNILVAFGVGLYASRKYAVPIFKLEKWVSLLREGNMCAQLRFREKEEMKELCGQCNALAGQLQDRFAKIKKEIRLLHEKNTAPEDLSKLEKTVEDLHLDTGPIEVHTKYMNLKNITEEDGSKE